MPKLTALTVKSAKPGRHADGDGLYLLVKPSGAKTWLLRVQVDGRRRDIGLGTADTSSRALGKGEASPIVIPILQRKILTLAEARDKAAMLRVAAKSGLDPIAERDRERLKIPKFRDAAKAAHLALKSGWSEKGAATFIKSLENHAFKTIGDIRVDAITAADISNVLTPIWTTKADMARKVRQRIGTVLNFAHGKGWRATEAPGRSVTVGLPRQPKGGNYQAMPYADVPAFVAGLVAQPATTGRSALLFQIYTAARPGEVRGARWGQIDLDKREWNRPASLMKGNDASAHTVTLNDAAATLLKQKKGDATPKPDQLVFPGQRGGMLSNMTMNKVLRTAGQPYDAHGFRSSFRDWAAEKMPEIPDPVAEAALAHVVPDKVVRAYKRTTFLEMRRKLLDGWGTFLSLNSKGIS
ncbi:integrase arm-type DNA-binding domain-containing protein [uncultured Sphingomonas sp.]|uniref:tyrosine-type recombinase/integrase n=1 Tax=uncultured Sphingomonas sp. TaxID=158754 RepID=UPI0025F57B00|nr:integrase arm-type DNA-binding domain-containing protein [uncultured Sphingomonas sp.]